MHSVSVVIADRANHEFMIYHELFRNSRKRGNSKNSCGNFAARVEESVGGGGRDAGAHSTKAVRVGWEGVCVFITCIQL